MPASEQPTVTLFGELVMERMLKTFISYSHDSVDHKRLVRDLADRLRTEGIECSFDQYEESPEEGWIAWMERELTTSSHVIVVCSQGYFQKFKRDVTGHGKGVKWEGAIITQELYEAEGKNRKFIPVVLEQADREFIPRVLRPYTHYNVSTKQGYEFLYRRLTKQPHVEKPPLGKVIKFPSSKSPNNSLRPLRKDRDVQVSQSIKGSRNVQVGVVSGNLKISTPRKPVVTLLPSPGSIGTNALLKKAIGDRFNRLGEEREKRVGKSAYGVMYKNFKREFGINENEKWTQIWDWPEAAADQIISYLDSKYADTISGRIKGAIKRGSLIPAKGFLFQREKELLEQLDLQISSPQVEEWLWKYFGVDSHTKLDRLKHWQWVVHLEKLVRETVEK